MDARLQKLQNLLNEQQMRFNESLIGQSIPVLFEKRGTEENQIIGKSPYMQGVHAHGKCDMIGQIKEVKITEAGFKALKGIIL